LARAVVREFVVNNASQADRTVSKIRNKSQYEVDSEISSRVARMISEIRKSGDTGLLKLTKKFDSPSIKNSKNLMVTRMETERAYSGLSAEQVDALRTASKQISFISKQQMTRFNSREKTTPLGFGVKETYVPFKRIGGYVPGGLASYPSTVLMIGATANEAGVQEIVIATPPRKDGSIDESVLVAADIVGIKEIVKAGGAQAIAALAFGTRTIKRVDMIVGPGNQYVTEAKRQVSASRQVLIDSLAGPTELLIVADKTADPKLVSEDLISQAEHGNRTLCGVVSNSSRLVRNVSAILRRMSDRKRLDQILQAYLFTVLVKNRDMLIEFAQRFAPEHLEVMVEKPKAVAERLTKSGLVLIGDFAPCSATDYIVGTNHILPTGGTARLASGLSVENFLKRVLAVSASRQSLRKSSKYIATLSSMENLPNHGKATLVRFRRNDS
jgi:histidinol dehydrogenase